MKKLLFAGLAGVLSLTSCETDTDDNGGGTTTTTVAQDKANMEVAMDDIVSCLGNMKNGSLINSIVAFTGMSEGEALKEEFVEAIFKNLGEAFDIDEDAMDDKLPFDDMVGTYTYNSVDSTWTKSTAQSTKIVLNFPSDDAATSNNVEAVVESYVHTMVTMDGESVYLPKSGHITVKKDGELIAEVNLTNVTYEIGQEISFPIDIDASIFVAPFTFNISGERSTSTQFKAAIDFGDGSCNYSAAATLNIAHSDYENLDDEDIVDLKGHVGHNNLKFNFFADIATINSFEDPTEDQVNDNLDLTVNYSGQKIADITLHEADEQSEDEVEVKITYKDGTSEDASTYLDELEEDLEDLFSDLTGAWDEEDEVAVQ